MQKTMVLEKIQMLPLPLNRIVHRTQRSRLIGEPGSGQEADVDV
jgi:hypothetical protein